MRRGNGTQTVLEGGSAASEAPHVPAVVEVARALERRRRVALVAASTALVVTTLATAVTAADVRADRRRQEAAARGVVAGVVHVSHDVFAAMGDTRAGADDLSSLRPVVDRASAELAALADDLPASGGEAVRSAEAALERARAFVTLLGVVAAAGADNLDAGTLDRLHAAWRDASAAADRAHRRVLGRPVPAPPDAERALGLVGDRVAGAGEADRGPVAERADIERYRGEADPVPAADLAEIERYREAVAPLLDRVEQAWREVEPLVPPEKLLPVMADVLAFERAADPFAERMKGVAEDLELMQPPEVLKNAHEIIAREVRKSAAAIEVEAATAAFWAHRRKRTIGEEDDYRAYLEGRARFRNARKSHDATIDDVRRRLGAAN